MLVRLKNQQSTRNNRMLWCMLKFHDLLDNVKCYEQLSGLRWPEGICCPRCGSDHVTLQDRSVMKQSVTNNAIIAKAVSGASMI